MSLWKVVPYAELAYIIAEIALLIDYIELVAL